MPGGKAAIPAGVGEYDLVVCSSVLSFVDDLDATVAEGATYTLTLGELVESGPGGSVML